MRLAFLLLLFSCSDFFIPENDNYRSIHISGGGYIEIKDQYDCENGLRAIDNDFSLEIYFSGEDPDTNYSTTLFSLLGKDTEYFTDIDCDGSFDPDDGEVDEDGNESLDSIDDDGYVVLMVATNPPASNKLFFKINDNENIIEFENMDFTNPDEFHLIQVLSDGDSLKFYLDNTLILTQEADIMIQGSSLMIGARANSTTADNWWHGYIDEVRLWKGSLSDNLREMHFEFPDKLVETIQDSDPTICNLRGLWTFNYSEATSNITDEKCDEILNLNENEIPCGVDLCDYPLDAIFWGEGEFSKSGF